MKNLPEHEPQSNSWERIMQKKDFDAQLSKNLKELPSYAPSDMAWDKIEEKLDEQKSVFHWRIFMIAASLAALFLVAFFLVKQETVQFEPQQPIAESIPGRQMPESDTAQKTKPIDQNQILSDSNDKESVSEIITQSSRRREFIPEISSRPPILIRDELIVKGMDLEAREKYNPIAETKEETYHSVAISWGLDKIKFQVKTNFGAQDPLLLESSNTEKRDYQARIRLTRKK
ncbi:hypothetical protein [Algoriphagus formosus]|uniref:hypothetical protein n=1 Tax=Algoriphagus formosus TaxID=2007308 RepID=UPI003F712073